MYANATISLQHREIPLAHNIPLEREYLHKNKHICIRVSPSLNIHTYIQMCFPLPVFFLLLNLTHIIVPALYQFSHPCQCLQSAWKAQFNWAGAVLTSKPGHSRVTRKGGRHSQREASPVQIINAAQAIPDIENHPRPHYQTPTSFSLSLERAWPPVPGLQRWRDQTLGWFDEELARSKVTLAC